MRVGSKQQAVFVIRRKRQEVGSVVTKVARTSRIRQTKISGTAFLFATTLRAWMHITSKCSRRRPHVFHKLMLLWALFVAVLAGYIAGVIIGFYF